MVTEPERSELAEIYDPLTMARIDARTREARHRADALVAPPDSAPAASDRDLAGRVRRGAAGFALTTALVSGVREALEPESDVAFEEVDNGVYGGPGSFVSVFFVPNDARATLAVVRPWLNPALNP